MTDRPGRLAAKKQAVAVIWGIALFFFLAVSPMADEGLPALSGQGPEASGAPPLCHSPEIAALLAEQEHKNAKEFRQIKRDIAALTQQVAEPGMREIIGGVGYILGLFGAAAYVASRKKIEGGRR